MNEWGSTECVTVIKETFGNCGIRLSSLPSCPLAVPDPGSYWPFYRHRKCSTEPKSRQRSGGDSGDWETQRLCSDAHLNKLVCKNTPVEDTSANVEEWDTDRGMADREFSKNTLDNHSTTANCLSQCLEADKLRALENVTAVVGAWNVKLVGEVSIQGLMQWKLQWLSLYCDRSQANLHDENASVTTYSYEETPLIWVSDNLQLLFTVQSNPTDTVIPSTSHVCYC